MMKSGFYVVWAALVVVTSWPCCFGQPDTIVDAITTNVKILKNSNHSTKKKNKNNHAKGTKRIHAAIARSTNFATSAYHDLRQQQQEKNQFMTWSSNQGDGNLKGAITGISNPSNTVDVSNLNHRDLMMKKKKTKKMMMMKKKMKRNKNRGKKRDRKPTMAPNNAPVDDGIEECLEECTAPCLDFLALAPSTSNSTEEDRGQFCNTACEVCICPPEANCPLDEMMMMVDEPSPCFRDCLCDQLRATPALVGPALELGCFETCEQLEMAGLFEIALAVGCYPCQNPIFIEGCLDVFDFLFEVFFNGEPVPEGICEQDYCDCTVSCAVLFPIEGSEERVSCDNFCFCEEVLEDPLSNPTAVTTCPSCANPGFRDLICEDFIDDDAFGSNFCDDVACTCFDTCYNESIEKFNFLEESFLDTCFEDCICDTIDPNRENICNPEVECLEGCVDSIQESFMLDNATTAEICENSCDCIVPCELGDLLCERSCGCAVVNPDTGSTSNQIVFDGFGCPCLDIIFQGGEGGNDQWFMALEAGCLESCEDTCELALGIAGEDADLEEVCFENEISVCSCIAANCTDPSLGPDDFNECITLCLCAGADSLVKGGDADPFILDFWGCDGFGSPTEACVSDCADLIQEPFMLDNVTTAEICENSCDCFVPCELGDLLCERSCGCAVVNPDTGSTSNQIVFDGFGCPCLDIIFQGGEGGNDQWFMALEAGCLESCEDTCELALGIAGEDADLEEVCFENEISVCSCIAANCTDPSLGPDDFNECITLCLCAGADSLVKEDEAEPSILDFWGCPA